MASRKLGNSDAKNNKWIKEGRGSGQNSEYKPWITVRDLPSDGRVHRVFGHKSQRTHHLLSDLELAVFLLLEWHQDVIQIREQFPLQLETTTQVAAESGISHPSLSGVKQYMSSDFLVNSHNPNQPKFVLQAKYAEAIGDARTVEKLELERRYWKLKEVPWFLVTEQDIPQTVIKNIKWLYPAQRDEIDMELLIQRVDYYDYHFSQNPDKNIIDICKKLDIAYELQVGESLAEVRHLLAKRCFTFDIFTLAPKLKAHQLKIGTIKFLQEAYSVSN
ncbi:TnsA endonuclease N-terminal domain-containing protein [Colwellia sp. MSW7]|uniref:TnsA endonuclease N-terminal domain-containing protein n=1 Tax=Colwellia maritima TaxID=2912588 RepID=A0ABS9WWT8_9GAMM|nr:TnsA endonuclease C-terminal domain-containing protein [Colwellia maritima]MCI2282336.1 TnsA endonuclease N-terminal domain-containing protein [Colwellia maritima]